LEASLIRAHRMMPVSPIAGAAGISGAFMPGETTSRDDPPGVSNSPETPEGSSPDGSSKSPEQSVREAMAKLAELRAYAREYLDAKADQFRLRIRHAILLAAVLLLTVLAIAASLTVAVVLLFAGLAQGVGALLGGRLWAGNLIVGGGMLALVIFGTSFGLAAFRRSAKKVTVAKYELSQKQQQQRFGRSSRDRTAAAGEVEL
jgi:hypothetical protein